MTFSLGDLATFLGIVGFFAGTFSWALKVMVSNPLSQSMDRLSNEIADFKKSSVKEHDKFNSIHDNHEHRIVELEKSDILQNKILDLTRLDRGGEYK